MLKKDELTLGQPFSHPVTKPEHRALTTAWKGDGAEVNMGCGTNTEGKALGGDDLSGILKDKVQWARGSGGKRVVQAVRETRSAAVQQGPGDLWQSN